jgi:hypothetical protein
MMTLIFILMEKPDYITQSMYEDAIASDKSGSERIADLSLLTGGMSSQYIFYKTYIRD